MTTERTPAGRDRWARLRGWVAVHARDALAADAGQSAVELVALLPVLVGLAFGLFTLLAAGRAHEDAAQAAEAGAVALLHDGDPRAAACAALARAERCRAGVEIRGRRITVSLRPMGPVDRLNRELQVTETADAGAGATR